MRFDRWRYDAEKNRFRNEPVIAATTNISDDIYVRELREAVMRKITAQFAGQMVQLERQFNAVVRELERKIQDLRDE